MISPVESAREKRLIFVHRYLWRLGMFALAALVFAWLFTHSYTTLYKAETEIAFKSTSNPGKFDLMGLFDNLLPLFMEDDIYSDCYDIPSIITSENVARRVLERNDLKDRLYDPKTMKPYPEWFDDFCGRLIFEIHQVTNSMTIAYVAETPELAKEITQLFGEEFESYFSQLYYTRSLADGIQHVVDRRRKELAEINVMINETLVADERIAAKRTITQDITDYLIAERGKLLTRAVLTGFDLALENVDSQIERARLGEDFKKPSAILNDYALVLLNDIHYLGNIILAELEAGHTEEHPEVRFWREALEVTDQLAEKVSADGVQSAYNTLVLRRVAVKAQYDFWSERVNKLWNRVEKLPQFEVDITWMVRKQKLLELTLWFWERRLDFQRLGENLNDDPFIVLDDPIVPHRAYYPILKVWTYAFPVLLVIGTLVFLMRFKIEEECIDDIRAGRI